MARLQDARPALPPGWAHGGDRLQGRRHGALRARHASPGCCCSSVASSRTYAFPRQGSAARRSRGSGPRRVCALRPGVHARRRGAPLGLPSTPPWSGHSHGTRGRRSGQDGASGTAWTASSSPRWTRMTTPIRPGAISGDDFRRRTTLVAAACRPDRCGSSGGHQHGLGGSRRRGRLTVAWRAAATADGSGGEDHGDPRAQRWRPRRWRATAMAATAMAASTATRAERRAARATATAPRRRGRRATAPFPASTTVAPWLGRAPVRLRADDRPGKNGEVGSGYAMVYKGPADASTGTVGHHSDDPCNPTPEQQAAADNLYQATWPAVRQYDNNVPKADGGRLHVRLPSHRPHHPHGQHHTDPGSDHPRAQRRSSPSST